MRNPAWIPLALALAAIFGAADARGDTLHQLEKRLPDEEELFRQGADVTLRTLRKQHHGDMMRRQMHGKAHGCIRGTFAVLSDRAPATRHGLFAKEGTYKVWARLSSAADLADTSLNVRGVAIKVIGVAGPRLVESDTGNTQDFLLNNPPVLTTRDIRQYVAFRRAILKGKAATVRFLAANPSVALRLARATTTGRLLSNPLVGTYFSEAPFAFGDSAAKFRIKPCKKRFNLPKLTGKHHVTREVKSHLSRREACFVFSAQLFKNERETPIEHFGKEWRGRWLPIARVVFAKQRFDSPAQNQFCEHLFFTPWQGLAAHRPLGSINRARKAVYEASAKSRHRFNNVQHREPTGDERFE